jgi:hypothetical protein
MQPSIPQLDHRAVTRFGQGRKLSPQPRFDIQNETTRNGWETIGTELTADAINITVLAAGKLIMGLGDLSRHWEPRGPSSFSQIIHIDYAEDMVNGFIATDDEDSVANPDIS